MNVRLSSLAPWTIRFGGVFITRSALAFTTHIVKVLLWGRRNVAFQQEMGRSRDEEKHSGAGRPAVLNTCA